jgi:hypothetical protein
LESLEARSLIDKKAGAFLTSPMVMEYVTDRLSEERNTEVYQKVFSGTPYQRVARHT